MPYTLTYNAELGIIEFNIQGDFTMQDVRDVAIAALQLGVEKGCDLYLSDFRQGHLKLSTVDIHRIPETVEERFTAHGLDIHRVKRALVVKEDLEDFKFFETVSANRGQQVRVFTDMEEAMQWLLGPGAAASPSGK